MNNEELKKRNTICFMRYVICDMPKAKGGKRSGFTLLELLLVIAIVAVLAGLILFALNPAERLDEASDTRSLAKSGDIRKAIESYSIANNGSLPSNLSSLNTYGLYDICKNGQSTNCINLDELVTGDYLNEIPTDDRYDTSAISGYKVEYDPAKKNVQIYSYENYIDYLENGATLANQQLAWWKTNEGSGTTTADSSGSYTGTLLNSPTWATGRYSNGLQFSGTNYVSTTLSRPESGSISLWAYPTTFNSWSSPIGWKVSGRFLLIDEGGGPTPGNWRASFKPTATETTISGPAIVQNTWTHLVFTWSLSGSTYTLRFYVNGVQVGTTTWTGTPDTDMGVLYFGTAGQLVSNNYTGRVDDVRVYGRAINADEVTALYNYIHSPVAHWKFDDASGTSAQDSSGNGINGTLTNGPTWTTGKYGGALNLDGTNDYVALPATSAFDLQNLTISAWVYSSNFQRNMFIFEKTTNNNVNTQYSCFFEGSNTVFRTNGGSSSYLNSLTGGIVNGQWNHIVCTYNGSTKRIYVNGVLKYTENYSATLVTNPAGTSFIGSFAHGGGYPTGGYFFEGKMDDIRIYNYGMNDAQIQKVMNNEI